jgi:gas vesicle structural protein
MALRAEAAGTNLVDVLDRVLDKGIVIDGWIRLSLVGLDLLHVEARIVVASIQTYLTHARSLASEPVLSQPNIELTPRRRRLPVQPRAA